MKIVIRVDTISEAEQLAGVEDREKWWLDNATGTTAEAIAELHNLAAARIAAILSLRRTQVTLAK